MIPESLDARHQVTAWHERHRAGAHSAVLVARQPYICMIQMQTQHQYARDAAPFSPSWAALHPMERMTGKGSHLRQPQRALQARQSCCLSSASRLAAAWYCKPRRTLCQAH